MKKDNFDEGTQLEEFVSQEDVARIKTELVSCPEANNSLVGTITALSKNYAKSVLITNSEMIIDEQGLIMDAFVFAAANYVAQAAVNKEFSVLISSKSYFYAPLKMGDILELEAHALFDESSKKRSVKVVGRVKEIKMFESSIQIICTDDHIFKLKRPPTQAVKQEEAPQTPASNINPEAMAASLLASMGK
ncbi:hypothetical protein SNU32_000072 [Campylobacter upsaliensis]|nr:hypothetical protein [Campylobacter upsaliensis]